MIHESYYWKKELYKSFLTIAKCRHLKRATEQSEVNVEKALMIGVYIIRKLDDAQKIPPDLLKRREELEFFVSQGTLVDHLNWHKIEKHYDFSKIKKGNKDWRFIINQIIHSFSLFFSSDDSGKLDGFLFNSDQTKKAALFFLPLKSLLTMLLTISEGDISDAHLRRDVVGSELHGKPKFGEMKLTHALYSYPDNFDVEMIISNTLKGNIYRRGNG
jgi:hypothetical protein